MKKEPELKFKNADEFIAAWKKSQQETELEMIEFRKTDMYKNALEELRKRNESRGSSVVKV